MSDPTPPSRPSRPQLSPAAEKPGARPHRPRPAATPAARSPVAAATPQPRPVAAPPPPRPRPPHGPLVTPVLRQTLVPPCLVLGLAGLAVGGGYFLQPADAALRQVHVAVPLVLAGLGALGLLLAALLALSLRGVPPR